MRTFASLFAATIVAGFALATTAQAGALDHSALFETNPYIDVTCSGCVGSGDLTDGRSAKPTKPFGK